MTIDTVVFDIGAVLLRWQPLDLLEDVFPGESRDLYPHIIGHPQWTALDAGLEEENKAIADFALRSGKSQAEMQNFMQEVRKHLSPIPESLKLFKDIKKAGFKTYVLSNMPSYLMTHYLKRDDFWGEFDGILCSSEVELLKPGKEIFEILFDRFSIEPSKSVFLDDTAPNIDACKNLGMQGVVFKDAKQCRQDLQEMGLGI